MEDFYPKFTAKIYFSNRVFYVTIADDVMGSLSIHYLISIWITYWWELHKILSFLTNMVNHFCQSIDAIWKTFL